METSEGRKTVRVGPDAGDGAFKTAISKYGFERNIHIFHIRVNSFSGIFFLSFFFFFTPENYHHNTILFF